VSLSASGHSVLSGGRSAADAGRGDLRLWDLSVFHHPGGRFVAPPARCVVATKEESRPGLGRFESMIAEARNMTDSGRFEEALYLIEQARKIPSFGLDAQALDLRSAVGQRGARERYRDGRCTRMLRAPGAAVGTVALNADASRALSGGPDKLVRLWDVAKGESVYALAGHTAAVNDVCFLPDGGRALSASEDGTLRLWDLHAATCLRTIPAHVSWVSCVAASPDGRWAISGGRDKTLRLWDLATGACLRTLTGHENLVRSVRYSACGRWALSGSFDKTLRFWDVATGQCVRTFEGHADIIHCVALDWPARRAVSAGNDKTVRLWDLASGRCLRIFQDHFERVLAVAMSGDGRWAVSGCGDKLLRLWNLVTGQCVQVFSGHTAAVTSLGMSPDGRWIVSGSHDQTVRLWELEWEYEFPAPADWDDGAATHLENFLIQHTPFQSDLPEGGQPSAEEISRALTRSGTPRWSENDFQALLATLRSVGYGWLRPDGVRRKLHEMAGLGRV
jgi:WD40 repeat protein